MQIIPFPGSFESGGDAKYRRPNIQLSVSNGNMAAWAKEYDQQMRSHLIENINQRLVRINEEAAIMTQPDRKRFLVRVQETMKVFIKNPNALGNERTLMALLMYFIDVRFNGIEIRLGEDDCYIFLREPSADLSELLVIQFLAEEYRKMTEFFPVMNLREMVTKLLYID